MVALSVQADPDHCLGKREVEEKDESVEEFSPRASTVLQTISHSVNLRYWRKAGETRPSNMIHSCRLVGEKVFLRHFSLVSPRFPREYVWHSRLSRVRQSELNGTVI